jgi:hypothetical protein
MREGWVVRTNVVVRVSVVVGPLEVLLLDQLLDLLCEARKTLLCSAGLWTECDTSTDSLLIIETLGAKRDETPATTSVIKAWAMRTMSQVRPKKRRCIVQVGRTYRVLKGLSGLHDSDDGCLDEVLSVLVDVLEHLLRLALLLGLHRLVQLHSDLLRLVVWSDSRGQSFSERLHERDRRTGQTDCS